jgi:hypothetical protein
LFATARTGREVSQTASGAEKKRPCRLRFPVLVKDRRTRYAARVEAPRIPIF